MSLPALTSFGISRKLLGLAMVAEHRHVKVPKRFASLVKLMLRSPARLVVNAASGKLVGIDRKENGLLSLVVEIRTSHDETCSPPVETCHATARSIKTPAVMSMTTMQSTNSSPLAAASAPAGGGSIHSSDRFILSC